MASDFRLKDQLPKLTERLVRTYDELANLNHLDHCPLPNLDEVIAALDDLLEIIFPGYRKREGLHHGNIGYYVGDLVDRLHDRLTVQIGRALRHEAAPACAMKSTTSKRSAKRRRCCSSTNCPNCAQ